MKIRELTQKAENLIEQGENAKQRQIHYQQQANSARAQVMSAYARLEAAASETDEEGNPIGDVSGARAEVYAAQALLESAEVNLAEANQQLEIVGRRKLDAVHEIERYENVEEGNMSKLAELQKKRFGANANAFMADLAARMNSGEQARQQLLHSMGMSSPGKSYSAGGVSGSAGGVAGTGSSGVGDVAASNTYGFAPAMLSHRDRIKWDYSQRAYAIWNNSNLSTSEKATLLRTEREKMQSELDLYDEKNSVPIMAKTRGGNTATKSFSAAERYEQLKADYCEDVGKILNDSSLNNSQKLAMIYDLQQKYSDTLVAENLASSEYGSFRGPLSWFGAASADSSKYEGIDRGTAARASVEKISMSTYKSPEAREKVLNHPQFAGMTEYDGKRAYVFGMNDAKLNDLKYSQGNNNKEWRMTCGIAQSANMLNRAGINETENSMVNYCNNHNLCGNSSIFNKEMNGGTSPARIATMLSQKGLPSHFDSSITTEEVANLVENGHGVIIGVNAGYLWSCYYGSARGNGNANHAISVVGTLRDESTHNILGFFINDTGRGQQGDQKRLVSLAKFNEAFDVPGHAVIATDNPIV